MEGRMEPRSCGSLPGPSKVLQILKNNCSNHPLCFSRADQGRSGQNTSIFRPSWSLLVAFQNTLLLPSFCNLEWCKTKSTIQTQAKMLTDFMTPVKTTWVHKTIKVQNELWMWTELIFQIKLGWIILLILDGWHGIPIRSSPMVVSLNLVSIFHNFHSVFNEK